MPSLAATGIPEFWGPEEGRVFLGPWCVPFDPAVLAPAGTRAQDPWLKPGRVHQVQLECRAAFEQLLPRLGEALDAAHGGVKRPASYWRVVIGPWLLRFLHLVADRSMRLLYAFTDEPGLKSQLLDPIDFICPRDILHFQELEFSHAYNLQILSQLTPKKNALPARRLPASADRPDWKPSAGGLPRAMQDFLVRRWGPRVLIHELFGNREYDLRILAAMQGSALPFRACLPTPPPPRDSTERRGLSLIGAASALEKETVPLLSANLPTRYLEGYPAARESVLKGWRRRPKSIAATTGWVYDEALKLAGAEFALEGTRLIGGQHGGGYGVNLDVPSECLESSSMAAYSTWGWNAGGDGTLRPLPQPRQLKLERQGRNRDLLAGRDILFVLNGYPLYPYQLWCNPFGAEVENMMAAQAAFVRAMSGAAASALKVRLYPLERGWRAKERLLAACPAVRLDVEQGSFPDRLSSARLVVVDCLETVFLEAIAFDKPCLVYLSERMSQVRESARPDMELLRQAGILCSGPDEAARRANEVYSDPRPWWRSEPARRAREAWLHRYAACAGEDWISAWKKFLLE